MIVYQKYIPKKFKFKKTHKELYRLNGFYYSNFYYNLSPFIFCKLIKSQRLFPHHFEAFRRVVKKNVKKNAFLTFYAMCDLPITSKKGGVRMGKGKAAVENWAFLPKGGFIFSSLGNSNYRASRFSFFKAIKKLPLKVKILKNNFISYKNLLNYIE